MFGTVLLAALTFDSIFAPVPPWGLQPDHIVWSPAGTSFLYELPTQDAAAPVAVRQYDLRSGESRVLLDPARYGEHPATPSQIAWSPGGGNIAFTVHGTLYVRDVSTGLDRQVAEEVGDYRWSPDGRALAYTHRANLYVAYLDDKLRVTQLTQDGVPDEVLNGDLDWVYPEELGISHGFAWSPDGRTIAFMRMDEREVTDFPIVDFLPYDNEVQYQRYPLAGEKNPRVTLFTVDVESRAVREIYDAGAKDEYIAAFDWQPDSHTLIAEILDRRQQHLRVNAWNGEGSGSREIYAQESPTWVDVIPLPVWLHDGRSLWLLNRENARALYLRERNGRLRRLTGAYYAGDLQGVDEARGIAYIAAAYPTRQDRSLLAVPFSGDAPRNLTPGAGSHAVVLSPTRDAFIDTYSSLNDPPSVSLVRTDTGSATVLAPRDEALRAELLPASMLQIPSQYGLLDAYMIRPPDFNPSKRYPVITYVYGGPQAPVCSNTFGGMRGLYHQMLARAGFIVFCIDGPASQLDDDAHVRLLYHNFGPGSLLGQEIGAQYLRSLPYVDPARLGIWGWSFGGFETVYALTHSHLWKAGAAGAPVTDWHLYDTIYTERYMGLPQENENAYDASSDLEAAADLSGSLLISQGTSDDNVHVANSIAMMHAFAAADRTQAGFEPYARERHGFTNLADLRRLYEQMLAWWQTHL